MIKFNAVSKGILQSILVICVAIISFYFLYLIQSVILYVIISIIIAMMGNPILNFLKNKLKFKHTFATVVTILIFILLIASFLLMFVPLILAQGQNLSLLNTAQIETNINELANQLVVFFENHNIDSKKILAESNLSSKLNFNFIPDFFNSFLSTIGGFGMRMASVLFITFFILKDQDLFLKGIKKMIPTSHTEPVLNSVNKINLLLSRYFFGLLLQLTLVFILYLIVLSIFDIPNKFIIAFLCAVLNIIPYVGPLIASIFAGVLTMLSHLGSDFQNVILPTTIYVLIGFWIVQLIDNNLSQPLIFSKSVSSHPLEIFLVILIAGFLTGILGMIVAVPLYTILKVIAKEFFPENKIVQLVTKDL